MANAKQRENHQESRPSDMAAALRAEARANFSASVQRMIDEKHLLRRLGDMPDLEMMEAATELTLKK